MKKVIFMLAAAATVATSCTQTDVIDNPVNTDGVLIQAKPVHQLVDGKVTRAPFDGNISSTNALAAQVVTIKDDDATNVYADGTMNFANTTDPVAYQTLTDGTKQFDGQNSESYTLYAMYPAGWTATTASATISFTGCEDIMVAAPDTTSADGVTSGVYPTLTFKHQLTKFIVKVQAANADAVSKWTNITAITVEEVLGDVANISKTATYDFSTRKVGFTGGGSAMPFYAVTTNAATLESTFTDDPFAAIAALEIPNAAGSNIHPVGYTMIAPFVSKFDKDIVLKVKASYDGNTTDGEKNIALNVPMVPPLPVVGGTPENLTTGYAYTITLTFTDKETIVATAEVVDWIEGEEIGGIVM